MAIEMLEGPATWTAADMEASGEWKI